MSVRQPVYLDYCATTPVDPRVLDAMVPYFSAEFGNPSSTHRFGQRAEAAVETARGEIAGILGCTPGEIIFTSGGTESDNLALRGVSHSVRAGRGANHILTTPVEHMAVGGTAAQLAASAGFEAELLPVSSSGQIDPDDVGRRLRPTTALVSIIYANNEIGTINPIDQIGMRCREAGILLHTDALQAALSLDLDVDQLGVDLLSLGAHKFYGPKGVGLLYVREGSPIQTTQTGGEQESGLRGGTLNVPLIVGMAEALKIARSEREKYSSIMASLRDRLICETLDTVPDARLTGHPETRLPNHASFVFQGVDGNLLLNLLDAAGFACSSGSACKTGSSAPSEVLLATGLSAGWALGSLRVSLGRWTTQEDVDQFCRVVPEQVDKARQLRGA